MTEFPPRIPVQRTAHERALSPEQRRLWFLNRLRASGAEHSLSVALRLTGALDLPALRHALGDVSSRHEVLRTVYAEHEGACRPERRPAQELFAGLAAEPLEASRLARTLLDEAALPFDLTRQHPLRARLFALAAGEHVLVLVAHRIAVDEASLDLLIESLADAYSLRLRNRRPPACSTTRQYAQLAQQKREFLDAPQGDRPSRAAEQLDHWRAALHGMPEQLSLPTERVRPAVAEYRGAELGLELDEELHRAVTRIAAECAADAAAVLHAALAATLTRFGAGRDLPIGTWLTGRETPERAPVVGPLANLVVLRTAADESWSLRDQTAHCAALAATARDHGDLPFARLVEELQPERSLNRHPLCQVAMDVTSRVRAPLDFGGPEARVESRPVARVEARVWELPRPHLPFDLHFRFRERHADGAPRGIELTLGYAVELFDEPGVRRLAEAFVRLLTAAVGSPDAPLHTFEVLDAAERHRLLEQWNETVRPVPPAGPAALFEERARLHPDAVALVHAGEEISYAQLDARVNRLAHALLQLGAGPGTFVAIALPRTRDLVATLLAVARTGAAYLPVDPEYPEDRIAYVLRNTAPAVVVADGSTVPRLPAATGGLLVLDDPDTKRRLDALPATNPVPNPATNPVPNPAAGDQDAAYVIYTSGSTGLPKGVVVGRRALSNFLAAMADLFPLSADDTWVAVTTVSFDIAALEIYLPLISGATLVLADRASVRDPQALARLLTQASATVMQATPSLWQALCAHHPEALRGLRMAVGGEALPRSLADTMRALGSEVTNLYGPTETTIWSTAARLDDRAGAPPIGRPIGNTRVYVLDAALRPVPTGVAGDLFIAGEGVAQGYLGRPDLTEERFLTDPYGRPGARMYRTGDVVRWAADGNLEFLGRADSQVKVRGFRIEPGEIETVLARHPSVAECVVSVKQYGAGDARLVAHVVPPAGVRTDSAVLRAHAAAALPDYMVPAAVMELAGFPLTPNGKIDRAALPEPLLHGAAGRRAPRTAREEQLHQLFSEVLGADGFGVDDSFFDLGGHSLLASRLIGRIRAVLRCEVTILALFEAPTVAALATRLGDAPALASGLVPVDRQTELPLSSGQQRLLFLHDFEPGGTEYNSGTALRLTGPLAPDTAHTAIQALVARHEILRTTFTSGADGSTQTVHPPRPVPLRRADLTHLAPAERAAELDRLLRAQATVPFDLGTGPLLRVLLVRVADEEHVLLLDMHHIVTDGWSKTILAREFCALYEEADSGVPAQLPPLPLQYADYAVWQRARLDAPDGDRDEELAYWRRKLAGTAPLDLPTDRPRPATRTTAGATHTFRVPDALHDRLTALCRAQSTTLFGALVASVQLLLSRYARQQDVALGTVVSGREHAELENVLGFFVNTLVLRSDVRPELTVAEFLAEVRQTVLEGFAHQNLPFDRLVDAVQPERDPSRTPLFQAAITLKRPQGASAGGLVAEEVPLPRLAAMFDLGFEFEERDGALTGLIEYNTGLFLPETVARLAEHLLVLVDALAADPGRSIGRLPMMSDAEHRRVTVEWNDTATAEDPARHGSVHRLVAGHARRDPHALALVSGERRLTYGELDARADLLARRLADRGARPGDVVAVRTARDIELVVAQLAVLKAGCAYLPLDLALPEGRAAYMLDDAGVEAVLTQRGLTGGQVVGDREVLYVEDVEAAAAAEAAEDAEDTEGAETGRTGSGGTPDDLAYVIYTSGSTGKAKGVLVEHRGVLNLCDWYRERYRITPDDRVSQLVAPGFDPTVVEVWGTLGAGASLWFAADELLDEPGRFAQWVVDCEITMTVVPAPRLESLLDQPALGKGRLRHMLTGADVVRRRLPADAPFTLLNHYGPTEATVLTTVSLLQERGDASDERLPSIGAPIANSRVYVLDERRAPVPVGVPGELYIGGAGLARGYLNRPDLTAERFLDHPFGDCSSGEHPFGPDGEGRLYRTGDLVRWLPDGELEFLGRVDDQVKIRGYRLELGEVENALRGLEGVTDAAVVTRRRPSGDTELIGFLQSGSVPPPDTDAVRAELARHLPEYMIPSALVVLAALPRFPNGKTDRHALPLPAPGAERQRPYLAPRNAVERALTQAWEQLLGVEGIGVEDDLPDKGANSILTLQITTRIQELFGVGIPAREVFTARTVAALAEAVRAGARAELRREKADHATRDSGRGE
ncbi:amino acid adenylation domain-containing protein [Streptomyces sp. NPDC021093]|uniref:amino acid adenylation domain-containing protein n=1 Tax=Streptomyces sp. NPDC021093 TaxID=3365112 RepID=UPI0037A607B1